MFICVHLWFQLPDGDDFIGQEVDYAARVAALANGGQILLSEVTAVFVRNAHIAGFRLHSHGDRNLKGIGEVPSLNSSIATRSRSPFLAEFTESRYVNTLVAQIVKWVFGYSYSDQDVGTVHNAIAETARSILQESDRKRVIKSLIDPTFFP